MAAQMTKLNRSLQEVMADAARVSAPQKAAEAAALQADMLWELKQINEKLSQANEKPRPPKS
jgi:hypothetical protein